MFIGDVTPEVDPRLYLSSIGQCCLTYAQLIGGVLQVAESVKSNNESSASSFNPRCRPSQSLINGGIPEHLLVGDGSDSELRKRLMDAVSKFDDHSGPLIPLVVNTHGWVSALGWQLIENIGSLCWASHPIELIKPNDSRRTSEQPDDLAEQTNEEKWGPVKRSLQIGSQFIDIIEQFCGRLPLGLDHISERGIRLIDCAFKSTPMEIRHIKSEHLRWLRFMSLFNSSYRYAVHFPITSPEGIIIECFLLSSLST